MLKNRDDQGYIAYQPGELGGERIWKKLKYIKVISLFSKDVLLDSLLQDILMLYALQWLYYIRRLASALEYALPLEFKAYESWFSVESSRFLNIFVWQSELHRILRLAAFVSKNSISYPSY